MCIAHYSSMTLPQEVKWDGFTTYLKKIGNKNSFSLRMVIHEKIVYGKMLNNIKTNGLSKYMSFEGGFQKWEHT